MRYTILVFTIALLLGLTACAGKQADQASLAIGSGFIVNPGNIFAESIDSHASYIVKDTVRNQQFEVYCYQDDSTNASTNVVSGYQIKTTVSTDGTNFSCQYTIARQ